VRRNGKLAGILTGMGTQRRSVRGLPVVGVAVAGVVLGHWLGYLLAVPDASIRAQVLSQSGHGYWLFAVKLAVIFGVTGLVTVFVRALGRLIHPHPDVEGEGDRFSTIAARLVGLQVLGFASMEVTERVAAGAPVASLLQHDAFLIGVLVQLLVAGIGALLLLRFARQADRMALAWFGARQSLPRPPAGPSLPAEPNAFRRLVVAGSVGVRGPPSR
jgi:hypothetical protein